MGRRWWINGRRMMKEKREKNYMRARVKARNTKTANVRWGRGGGKM